MKMTLHTDYALRMLIFLATRRDYPTTVQDVATAYRLSRNHLLKVALGLNRLGLVETTRGRSGGINLAIAPEKINLGTLIREMEDDLALVECMKPDGGACIISPGCRLGGIVREALEAYLAVFDKYTLADLVKNRSALASLLALAEPDGDNASQQSIPAG